MRLDIKRKQAVALVLTGLLGALVAWAWVDGGRRPLREIAEPVAVPESAR